MGLRCGRGATKHAKKAGVTWKTRGEEALRGVSQSDIKRDSTDPVLANGVPGTAGGKVQKGGVLGRHARYFLGKG